jgi:polysaccharide biosynthesis transport protein
MEQQMGRSIASQNLDIRAAIGALRRNKWIILTSVFLGVIAGVLSFVLITPRYVATSSVMIDPQGVNDTKDAGTKDDPVAEDAMKVLGSRSTLEEVMKQRSLGHDPEFNSDLDGANLFHPKRWVVQAKNWAEMTWLDLTTSEAGGRRISAARPPLTPRGAPAIDIPDRTYQRFLEHLKIGRDGLSRVLVVSFTSISPEKAAIVANSIVDTFVRNQLSAKVAATERNREWLSGLVSELRNDLGKADQAVEAYRAANNLADDPDGSLLARQRAGLKLDLANAFAERKAKEEKLKRVYALRAKGGGSKSLTEIVPSPVIANLVQREDEVRRVIAQLSVQYGDKHPIVAQATAQKESLDEKIAQEIGNMIRSLEDDVEMARTRERALQDLVNQNNSQTGAVGWTGIKLRELERDAASKRAVYETALGRLKSMGNPVEPDARVISVAAAPSDQSFPKLRSTVGVGLVGSLLLGIGLAALREQLDRGLRTGRQVEESLGIVNLGVIPRLNRLGGQQRPHRYLLEKPLSAYAEAIKSVFTQVHLAHANPSAQVVLVTSTLPGEGKTTFAMSLAASIANSGHETVVVDLDLRHPSVARELSQPIELGLIECISDRLGIDAIVQTDRHEPNLHVIPVKNRTSNAVDLLGTPLLRSLIAELRCRYEYIILDSPPILGFSDTQIAAQLADAVLLVVQWEKTSEIAAADAVELLLRNRVPIVGAALTQVDVRRYAKYCDGAGQYHRRYDKLYAN